MAEGWGKQHLGDKWNVYSAGIEAHGVNPNAIKAMREVNIDITDQTSDIIDTKILNNADLVVTLCNHADSVCPSTPPLSSSSVNILKTNLHKIYNKGGTSWVAGPIERNSCL